MSGKELNRVKIIEKTIDKRISQIKAAESLGVTARHLRYLIAKYKKDGDKALISQKRGKRSNRSIPGATKKYALSLIKSNYQDYGPTLAAEKLLENHYIKISRETIRQWLIYEAIWKSKTIKPKRVYQPRYRRANYGELLQMDGSDHDWFEGRGDKCTLLVLIDDATSKIQKLLFVDTESTLSYFEALKSYIKDYGKPLAIYTDKHSVFKINMPQTKSGNGMTQFGRALDELGIKQIFANSPQAKGRVERANRTLQDRLVKELRYQNISNIEDANKMLEEYRVKHNKMFAKTPKEHQDFHTKLSAQEQKDLDLICSIQFKRQLSKSHTISLNNVTYIIKEPDKVHRLYQAQVTVSVSRNTIKIYYKGETLNYEIFKEHNFKGKEVCRSELEYLLNKEMLIVQQQLHKASNQNQSGISY